MSTDEVVKIIKLLKKTYPDAKCSLNFENPFELAIAVMLSAQCNILVVASETDLLALPDHSAILRKTRSAGSALPTPTHRLDLLDHICPR